LRGHVGSHSAASLRGRRRYRTPRCARALGWSIRPTTAHLCPTEGRPVRAGGPPGSDAYDSRRVIGRAGQSDPTTSRAAARVGFVFGQPLVPEHLLSCWSSGGSEPREDRRLHEDHCLRAGLRTRGDARPAYPPEHATATATASGSYPSDQAQRPLPFVAMLLTNGEGSASVSSTPGGRDSRWPERADISLARQMSCALRSWPACRQGNPRRWRRRRSRALHLSGMAPTAPPPYEVFLSLQRVRVDTHLAGQLPLALPDRRPALRLRTSSSRASPSSYLPVGRSKNATGALRLAIGRRTRTLSPEASSLDRFGQWSYAVPRPASQRGS